METIIREAVIDDIEALIRCHNRFMEHHITRDKRFTLRAGSKEKWDGQISDSVKDPDTLVLVAENKTIVVGCAYAIIKSGALDFGPEKIGYLCDVYVDPDYRREGIAKRFLTTVLNWLKERGITTIEASWSVHSTEAQKTWPSLGFIPISISGQLEF